MPTSVALSDPVKLYRTARPGAGEAAQIASPMPVPLYFWSCESRLKNILGTPPPMPPANVPALQENENNGGQELSLRQRMEAHRKNPACAGCHRVMDPVGFSLDNFDAVGRWRMKEGSSTIDASGQLADGTKGGRPRGFMPGSVEPSGSVRSDHDGQTADLCPRPWNPVLRHTHPTQKPLELMRRPILNHTRPGELVYDPFLGSGTTLAAAERIQRVCYGMELDPKYADVAIQRWQGLSGKQATLEGDGGSFEAIAQDRVRRAA